MAEAIRDLGYVVHTMAEVYPGGLDEKVSDITWIQDADTAGWIALTKDERITRYPHEQAAHGRRPFRLLPRISPTRSVRFWVRFSWDTVFRRPFEASRMALSWPVAVGRQGLEPCTLGLKVPCSAR